MKQFNNQPLVGIIMGSDSDLAIMQEAAKVLDEFKIPYELTIVSAHRTPKRLFDYASSALRKGLKIIIAGAGGSAHLPGMIASLTPLPVIGVPIKTKSMDGLDSLLSIVQMPPGIPVATVAINGAENAGILAVSIIGVNDKNILSKVSKYKIKLKNAVVEKAGKLEKIKYKKYLKGFGKKYSGKTRDYYIKNGKRIIISTDRISAFDKNLGYIPYKGQVLNQLSCFWFEKTKDIIPNHLVSTPSPNIMVVKNAKLIPIEMVVRGYITGVTGTSIWGSYEKGERTIYGLKFPQDLRKNQKLPLPIITPTTKAQQGHDERLTRDEIIKRKIVSKKVYEQMERISLELFERGTKICAKAGIILVDTKYEFGIYKNKLILIDEIHTPDSSRFWIKKTYKQRFEKGLEPENFDKEFLRIWYAKRGYKGEGIPPKMPRSFINQVSNRYISIYKKITGKKFIKEKLI